MNTPAAAPGPAPRDPVRVLVLASSSRHRQSLLARLGVPFTAVNPAVDERVLDGESPRDLVVRLARAKAAAIPPQSRPTLVIGSDQVAVIDGRIVGKPGSLAAAATQLRAAVAVRHVDFLTSLCVLEQGGDATLDVVGCRVHFRALSTAQIDAYVAREQPLDCAGSFRIEGLGITLFERIETDDPTALIGLPLMCLTRRLDEFGYDVLQGGGSIEAHAGAQAGEQLVQQLRPALAQQRTQGVVPGREVDDALGADDVAGDLPG